MIFTCVLCEKETCYVQKFCDKCRKIKHHLNLSGDRVYEILDNVLSREEQKQRNKEKLEINKEIENLRAKQIKRGTEVD